MQTTKEYIPLIYNDNSDALLVGCGTLWHFVNQLWGGEAKCYTSNSICFLEQPINYARKMRFFVTGSCGLSLFTFNNLYL